MERHGDGGASEQAVRRPGRAHINIRLECHVVRSRLQPFLSWTWRGLSGRSDFLSGARLARNVRAGFRGGATYRRTLGQFSTRATARRWTFIVSASLADARVLGI